MRSRKGMLVVGTAAARLPEMRIEKGKTLRNSFGSRSDTKEVRKPFRSRGTRGERGQVLILTILAMPLFIALIALVADGSNIFANKRSVQNVADATALALARDLPNTGAPCTGACLTTLQADAITYSNLNRGPTVDHACASPDDTNCYQTPYKGDSSLQVRVKRTVSTYFAGAVGLLNASVRANAAVGIGGTPNAAGNVAPIGVDKQFVCLAADTACFGQTKVLNFQAPPGYSLLDLDRVSKTAPISGNTASTTQMSNWVTQGYPGVLPANAWYGAEANSGGHNGMRSALASMAASGTPLLVPVFGIAPPPATSPDPTTGAYYVIGFAAFVINDGTVTPQSWQGNSITGTHTITGHFTAFIATGVSGGPIGGPTDFGVHVVTLDE
jgi:Flp pilus assembly protein TadG